MCKVNELITNSVLTVFVYTHTVQYAVSQSYVLLQVLEQAPEEEMMVSEFMDMIISQVFLLQSFL